MRKKYKKPVGGVYASQDWSQKKLSESLAKRICFFIKGTFCVNTLAQNGLERAKFLIPIPHYNFCIVQCVGIR